MSQWIVIQNLHTTSSGVAKLWGPCFNSKLGALGKGAPLPLARGLEERCKLPSLDWGEVLWCFVFSSDLFCYGKSRLLNVYAFYCQFLIILWHF